MGRSTILFLLLVILLAGCGRGAKLLPTPFPTTGPTVTPGGIGPVELTVSELMSAPGLYIDVPVRVTGLLRKQPLIICDTNLYPSPATWGLAEEGVLALAGGLDQQVRSLLPDDLAMTVEGRWRRWQGLVGCGKQAQQREVWYLEADRIISPSPLTQVTLTPASGEAIAAVTAEVTPTTDPSFGENPQEIPAQTPQVGELPSPESTTETDLGAFPNPTSDIPGGQTLRPTPPLTTTQTIAATPAATPATTPAAGTGTPDTSPTVTPGGTPPTPTATTAAGGSGQVVARGNLYDVMDNDFITATLGGGTTDSWEIDIFEGEPLTVHVVAPAPADIIVSILKNGTPVVNRQNTAPAGSPEIINNAPLQGEGLYEIQVTTVGGASTDYALTFFTEPDNGMIIIPGMIVSGNPRSAVELPENSYHYWFFVGKAGDDVTIVLTPLGNEDVGIYLYAPDGEQLGSADVGLEGDEEVLEFTLTANGLYAIGIEELYSEALEYNLELTIE
ncbi:MAG: hypothetical protein DCC51_07530 [Anaerolineae bacterium]|nr:MAG: hypothetical protein DCC51_07530 [Anaerolineae bacterium]